MVTTDKRWRRYYMARKVENQTEIRKGCLGKKDLDIGYCAVR
jgi:hypothetical protein